MLGKMLGLSVCRLWLMLILFKSYREVYGSHFRGAVIMVRPKPGGAAKEVVHSISNFMFF